jgi:nitroimidazol reductase NimA-like FMN-containing flavoprotein (pyridoxamine 5'-phosphate oxidase superfamily)
MRRKEREETDSDIIEKIIIKADVCRIAMANDNIPYLVTMNFGYASSPVQCLYFHCANEGRKLEMIRKNSYVCFQMDTDHKLFTGLKGCDWGMKYSSVVGYGNISVVTEKDAREKGLNCIMNHYGGADEYLFDVKMMERTTILRLDIKEITGKIC